MTVQLLLVCIGALSVVVFWKLMRTFRLLKFRPQDLQKDGSLPSVSICIPVRNEVHTMSACLDRVVASDYPKLEIIVLDDASRDNTSLLVKSYASAGVRFIESKQLPSGWIGKNYAQNVLAHEASGSVVFFIDVDTMIKTDTIGKAVAYMMAEKADMVSIIPQRDDLWRGSTFFATLRHFWTIIRFLPSKPRATCNAWLIKRDILLDRFDQDKSLPMSFQVESTIARTLAPERTYRLVLSDRRLGIYYEKKWQSQVETAIRLLYPQCDKNFLEAMGLTILLGLLLVPFGLIFVSPIFAGVLVLLELAVYAYYLSKVRTGWHILLAVFLPYILLQEIILIFVSVWRYNFGTITWKGRPITSPNAKS